MNNKNGGVFLSIILVLLGLHILDFIRFLFYPPTYLTTFTVPFWYESFTKADMIFLFILKLVMFIGIVKWKKWAAIGMVSIFFYQLITTNIILINFISPRSTLRSLWVVDLLFLIPIFVLSIAFYRKWKFFK